MLASSLKYSNNFTSEQVLRTLGWRMSGEPGSWAHGCAAVLGIDTYGESAPAGVLFKHFHLTAENLAATVRQVLGK